MFWSPARQAGRQRPLSSRAREPLTCEEGRLASGVRTGPREEEGRPAGGFGELMTAFVHVPGL